MIIKPKIVKRTLWITATVFVFTNIIALFHAYKFTHFARNVTEKTKNPEKSSSFDKIKTLVFGIYNPRPENTASPTQPYSTIRLKSNKEIEC